MIEVYNKFGKRLNSPEVIELQWNRKYFETGDFVLYISAKDYSSDFQYIRVEGRPETGIFQKPVYEEKPEGEFVTLSGYFLDTVLYWGSPLDSITYSGRTADAMKVLLYKSFRQYTDRLKNSMSSLPSGVPAPSSPVLYETTVGSFKDLGGSYTFSVGASAGEQIRDLLKSEGLGLICTPAFGSSESLPLLGVEVSSAEGRDLRDSIYFGTAFGNVSKIELARDFSPCRSQIIGLQEVPNDVTYNNMRWVWKDSKWVKVITEELTYHPNDPEGLGTCSPAKVIFTNAENVEAGKESSVRSQMRQALKLEMLNNYKIEQVSVDVLQDRFYYMKDYDLGDICTVSVDAMQVQFASRIIEVHEVYSGNKMDVQLILGTQSKREYRRVI